MNRIAALISGEPRYWRGFDLFLANTAHLPIDWHVMHWRNSPPTDKGQVVPPTWQYELTDQFARDKLTQLLPPNHRLATLSIRDQSEVRIHQNIRKMTWTTPEAVSKMTWGWWAADQQLQEYQKQHHFTYPYTIRTRPDLALSTTLDWQGIEQALIENPRLILADFTDADGQTVKMNDYLAIGTGENISWYCQLYHRAEELNQQRDHWYGSLELLYYHCKDRDLEPRHYPLNVYLRGPEYQFNSVDFANWL